MGKNIDLNDSNKLFSDAKIVNNIVFTSGLIGVDFQTNMLVGNDVESQFVQIIENLKKLVEKEELELDNVFKINVFLSDIKYQQILLTLMNDYFMTRPVISFACVSALPKNAKLMMEFNLEVL